MVRDCYTYWLCDEKRATDLSCKRIELPLIKSWKGRKLDLTGFDFDELLD